MSWIMRRRNKRTGEAAFYCEDNSLPFPTETWRKFYYEHDVNRNPRRPADDLDWAKREEMRVPYRSYRVFDSEMQAQICLELYGKKRTERGHAPEDTEYIYDYVEY